MAAISGFQNEANFSAAILMYFCSAFMEIRASGIWRSIKWLHFQAILAFQDQKIVTNRKSFQVSEKG